MTNHPRRRERDRVTLTGRPHLTPLDGGWVVFYAWARPLRPAALHVTFQIEASFASACEFARSRRQA